jgi:hypothetical protein
MMKMIKKNLNLKRCCIAVIECLSAMLNETEFYESRRQVLKNDKLVDLK